VGTEDKQVTLKQYTTSIAGRSGFGESVEVTINQTVRAPSKAAAEKLIAEYPNAAKWSEEAKHGN
jgi:hypothetical protein